MHIISLSIGGTPMATWATFTRHNPVPRAAATTAVAATSQGACGAADANATAFAGWCAFGPDARRAKFSSAAEAPGVIPETIETPPGHFSI